MKHVISWLKQLVEEKDYLYEANEEFLRRSTAIQSLHKLDKFLCQLGVGCQLLDISHNPFGVLAYIKKYRMKK
jgi:hypothetical protein